MFERGFYEVFIVVVAGFISLRGFSLNRFTKEVGKICYEARATLKRKKMLRDFNDRVKVELNSITDDSHTNEITNIYKQDPTMPCGYSLVLPDGNK